MTAPGLPPPFRLIAHDTLGSTNDELKRLARSGEGEGLVVMAGRQTAGRGRRGRAWVSPPGNLYASLLLRPDCGAATAAQLGFAAVLAAAEALGEFAPEIELRCKWPNDLLANGKKIAGILLETEMVAEDLPDFVILGVGINLASSPRDTTHPATSLAQEGVAEIPPSVVVAAFIHRFAAWLARWRAAGFAPLRDAWLRRAAGLGGPIRVRLERTILDGRFLDLDSDGALRLGLPSGERRIAAGEVFPARAA
jgi:BirA family biotin operon repressor/biotin-[acetyl-CoA-carboxylase] ligase